MRMETLIKNLRGDSLGKGRGKGGDKDVKHCC